VLDTEEEKTCMEKTRKCCTDLKAFCVKWKSHALYLYALLPLLLIVVMFAGKTLYYVYVVGDNGSRECRSIVLLGLVVVVGVLLVCVLLAKGTNKVLLFTDDVQLEVRFLVALVVVFLGGAWCLGIGDGVSLSDDLNYNPFKMLTSRCQPAAAWGSSTW